MKFTVNTVGELKNALKDIPDDTRFSLKVTGYSFEDRHNISLVPSASAVTLDIEECFTRGVVEISNSSETEMEVE